MALLPSGARERNLVGIVAISVIAVVAYYAMVFSPRSTVIEQKREHAQALAELNHKAKLELAKGNINEIRKQLAEYQQNLVLIRTLIPNGNEVPALLEQVSTAARRVGLDVATVDPQPVLEGENYDTYKYSLSVVGGYHELAAFLTNVGNLTRIVLPVNVTLQPPSNPQEAKDHSRKDEAVIEARFQLQTFVTKTPEPEPTFGAPKKGGAKS